MSDKEKRDIYDKYGEEGVKEGRGQHDGMNDIFSHLFTDMNPRYSPKKPKKGKPVMHSMKLTLEDIFNGKSTKIAVNRERICQKCDGKGGKEGAV